MKSIQDISKQPIVEWGGQPVITTAQLAEVYGTTPKNITHNFNRNKERFEAGKHYICLSGDDLKEFMRVAPERCLPSSTSIAYLWTRRGASRHCKILGTDKAWEQFDYLEENYFDRQEQKRQAQPLTLQQQIQTIAKGTDELYSRMDGLEDKFAKFEQDLPLFPEDADEVKNALNKKVVEHLGGKDSVAYHDQGLRQKAFIDAYRELKRNFKVSTYKSIKRNQKKQALEVISAYRPPVVLLDEIQMVNSQLSLSLEGGAC